VRKTRFVVSDTTDGFIYTLQNTNGDVLVTSRPYKRKNLAVQAAERLQFVAEEAVATLIEDK
jgi:uncharacterized protein YegP (UPF0339 family)